MTLQLSDYNEEQIAELVAEIVHKGYAVLHDQKFTQREYVNAVKKMGECDSWDYFMNPPDNPEISIVSGQVDENGKAIGMFSDQELEWHANGAGRHEFNEICVGLYCHEECIDTVLSICNQCDMFAELPEEEKDYYRSIDIHLDAKGVQIWPHNSAYDGAFGKEGGGENSFGVSAEFYGETIDRVPLIRKHPVDGREYCYFLIQYIKNAYIGDEEIDIDKFYADLWPKMFRSKYMFHHVFRRGDLLFMDQLHTIHRRSPIKYKDRMLWRTAFDYSNTKF